MTEEQIILSHDGAGDDLLGMLLLLTYNVDIKAIILTPADAYLEPALENIQMILNVTNKNNIPITINNVSFKNDFPKEWKEQSYNDNEVLRTITKYQENMKYVPPSKLNGYELLVEILSRSSDRSIIFIETGPMTLLGYTLSKNKDLEKKIKKVIWMGGSFDSDISETLKQYKYAECEIDGTQSWNSFCDPINACNIFNSDHEYDLILVTKEVTDKVPISKEFFNSLPNNIYGDIFKAIYNQVKDEPYYRMWDVVTVGYLGIPEAFSGIIKTCTILTEGSSQGRTVECNKDKGKSVLALIDINLNLIYKHILNQLITSK